MASIHTVGTLVLVTSISLIAAFTTDCLAPSNCKCLLVFHNKYKLFMSAVDCSHRNFTQVPHLGYQKHDKLYYVNLAHNRISSLHRVSFPEVSFLQKIVLAGNPMSHVHRDAFRFVRSSLQELDLTNTDFDTMKKSWFLRNLHHLKTLTLDKNNRRSVVPSNMFRGLNLYSLRVLSLKYCGLLSLEVGAFVGLEKLEILDIRYNRITTLSSGLWDLISLETLYADHNKVKYLHDGWLSGLSNLRELYVSNNKLDASDAIAEGAFLGLERSLSKIDASHNGLPYVPSGALSLLTKLHNLDISYNKIRVVLDRSFKGYCLRHLNLSGNPIDNTFNLYNGALHDQEKCLEYLYMRNLGISSLPGTQLKYMRALKVVDASHNHLSDPVLHQDVFTDIRSHSYVLKNMGIIDIDMDAFAMSRATPIKIDLRNNRITSLSFVNNASDCTFYLVDVRRNPIECHCPTARVLYSGTVRRIKGTCINRHNYSFFDRRLRSELADCEGIRSVSCPYWYPQSSASSSADRPMVQASRFVCFLGISLNLFNLVDYHFMYS